MASRNLGSLTLDLVARTGKFNAGMASSERRVDAWSKHLKKVLSSAKGEIATVFAGIAFGAVVGKVIHETTQIESAVKQIEARLKSTGGVVGITSSEFRKFAEELQRVTTFSDDAVLGMQSVLLTFTRVRGDTFNEATRAILDLSVAMSEDLQSAAVQVGKALNDPIKGLTALQRIGVGFTASQKNLIKSFVDAGDVASAQGVILKQLSTEFGGAAVASTNTLSGAIKQLRNSFDDLFEAEDGVGPLTESVRRMNETIRDPGTVDAFQTLTSALLTGLKNIIDTAAVVINVFNWFVRNKDKIFLFPQVEYVLKEFQVIGTDLEKIQDDIELLEENLNSPLPFFLSFKEGVMDAEDMTEKLKELNLEYNRLYQKRFGSMGATRRGGPLKNVTEPVPGDEEAIKEIEKVRDGLQQQIAAFNQSAAAAMRYRIEQGDLAEAFKKARKEGEPFKAQLIELAAAFESRQLTKEIQDQTNQLRDQSAVLGMNAEQTMRYRIEQGDLAETFKRMGAAGKIAAAGLIAQARATDQATNAFHIKAMVKDLRDQIAVFKQGEAAVLSYRIAQGDLAETFENTTDEGKALAQQLVDLTLQMQLMEDVADGLDKAVSDMSESLKEGLDKFLDDFEKRFIEQRDVLLEFMQGLARGTEGIIADALLSGFEGGAKGILKSFGELMRRLIAEAIAADLAKRIFGAVAGGVGTGWLGAAATALGFKGKATGGPIQAGMPYLVGERGPEIVIPSRSSTVIPNGRIGGQTNYISLTVQTPTGRVPMETQQQMGNRLARALGDARRRNG